MDATRIDFLLTENEKLKAQLAIARDALIQYKALIINHGWNAPELDKALNQLDLTPHAVVEVRCENGHSDIWEADNAGTNYSLKGTLIVWPEEEL